MKRKTVFLYMVVVAALLVSLLPVSSVLAQGDVQAAAEKWLSEVQAPVISADALAVEAGEAEAAPEAAMEECDFAMTFDSLLAERAESFFTTAEALFDNLHDGDESNDPFILDVREPEHYEGGHIPGAINVPWTQVAKEENLDKLPMNKQIVVYCYTGQAGAMATIVLGAMGYDAINLLYGMSEWTLNEEANPVHFVPERDSHDYPFEGTAAE